jgi:hypothetical protein
MKKMGLTLMSVSALLFCIVIFQNCGGFNAATGTSPIAALQTCPAGMVLGSNGICTTITPPVTTQCTGSAMQSCTGANGSGLQTCNNGFWSSCVLSTCNAGYALDNYKCFALGCNGSFLFNFNFGANAKANPSSPFSLIENGSGAFTVSAGNTSIGSGTCSNPIGGTSGTVQITYTLQGVAGTCSGSYSIANGKTAFQGNCNYPTGSLPFTAQQE